MKLLLQITLLMSALYSAPSFGETNYSLDARARTRPQALNVVGTVASDGMLWGNYSKDNPMYGYYRAGAKLGGTPSYAAFLQVAPVAPLVFEVQRGNTHRFLKISTFDCEIFECKGKVERTDYSVRLAGAYQNFVIIGSAMWRELRTADGTTPVALELEYFAVTPGFHRYFESTVIAGYKLQNDHLAGLMATNGLLSEGDRKSSSVYGFYRFPWMDFVLTGGIGSYKSDSPDQDGTSVIFALTRNWGDRLSLF